VILAHNYQVPEVQDVADHMGDSLALSRLAAASTASVIVFAGVYFMAETAKILAPDRTVLIPEPRAGCSLADTVTAQQVRDWKAEHPGAAVVAYVNTSAEVKAESDLCCTSANAAQIVSSIPEDQDVLFLPGRPAGGQRGLRLAEARAVAATGVDFFAVGALTHSSPALDLGLDLLPS
jgi:quinolinate synthase